MTEQPTPTVDPQHEGDHIYEDRWHPFDRQHIWRKCVLPTCTHFQKKKALS